MCGIFGAVGVTLGPAAVRRMLLALRHRGPDDWGVWTGGLAATAPAGVYAPAAPGTAAWGEDELDAERWAERRIGAALLAQTRLAIVDLSRASHQPFLRDGSVLVFNGEIYNYPELRAEIEAQGRSRGDFVTRGDVEVLLAGWLAWGPDVVRRLDGAYAFAVWDRLRGELFAARDRLGKKPLYWAPAGGDGLVFASELKALWGAGVAPPPRLDPGSAARYLAFSRPPDEDATAFAGVHQLPAGSWLRLRPGEAPRIERYWDPDAPGDRRPRNPAGELRELLMASLRLRYRADVPVGLCLSGGVDSAGLLAGSAALRGRNPEAFRQPALLTFSAVHPASVRHDERAEIEQILAAVPGVEARFLDLSEDLDADAFLAFLARRDEPLRHDGVFVQDRFMARVAALGMKVMASGQGADELFLGYPWYVRPYALSLVLCGRLVAGLRWLGERRRREGVSWPAVLRDVASGLSPARLERHKRRSVASWLRPAAWDGHAAPAYRDELARLRSWPDHRRDEVLRGSLPALLQDEDRSSMGHGVETRLPYLDPPLVEWALGLDPAVCLAGGATKRPVREAWAHVLPREIVFSTRKQGFYLPVFSRFPELAARLDGMLEEAAAELDPIVDRQAIRAAGAGLDAGLRFRLFSLATCLATARRRVA